MTADVFGEWKRYHFVKLEPNLVGERLGVTVLLTDIKYWTDNMDALQDWCQRHGAIQQGMTVDMDEQSFLMFALKWDGQKA